MQTFGITPEWIQRLKDNTDIVSVISRYVTLQTRGRKYWACCPFHFEKTPSFTIDENEQFFKCFGCGVGGDVITFVMKMESCDFYDACKILAKDAGMEMPAVSGDSNIAQQKKDMDTCYNLLRDLAKYYYDNLKLPEAKAANDYLAQRGVESSTITSFGIGYSLGYDQSLKYLKDKGYSFYQMKMAGVASESSNNHLIDCYALRLIFPIINARGDVVGFSGRILEKNPNIAKYKNTPATILFDKSRLVFGINLLKKEKQLNGIDSILIVEGQMDVISLWQAGIKNVVACMGTAMTPYHVKELKKLSNKVILCFDGDAAGQKATFHSIDTLYGSGMEVFVVSIPNNEDPDEYIKSHGVDEFRKLMSNAKYWAEFMIESFAKNLNKSDPNSVAKFVKSSLGVVSKLPSESEKYLYLDIIKKYTNISVDVLRSDLGRLSNESTVYDTKVDVSDKNEEKHDITSNAYVKAINHILACILNKKSYAYFSLNIRDNILDSDKLKLYDYMVDLKSRNLPIIIGNIYSNFDVENNVSIKDIVDYVIQPDVDNVEYYDSCVKTLENYGVENKRKEILQKLKETTDANERRKLLMDLNNLVKIK